MQLADLTSCFGGAIPAVIATASSAGTPNVTYLSRCHLVDAERIALSNQFFSKSARNIAENPRASLLLMDPHTGDQYRLAIRYERTERRGRVFESLRTDIDAIAGLVHMQDVFRLRAADIFRVTHIEALDRWRAAPDLDGISRAARLPTFAALGELCARVGRCADLDTLVSVVTDALAELLGFEHVLLALVDEDRSGLFTIASHGYPVEGIGSEIAFGAGVIGLVAQQGRAMRIGSRHQLDKYAVTVHASFETAGDVGPSHELPVPHLAQGDSQLAVPAVARGEVVGVLQVEDRTPVAFDEEDEANLTVVATLVANAIETLRAEALAGPAAPTEEPTGEPLDPSTVETTLVRHYAVDGSTFVDGDYLIKGVAGRIVWSLLGHHDREGRVDFTNKEVRLDPSLDLPDFRDNFESRLILLKRRLDEREAPIRITKTGRGRFRLDVERPIRLELIDAS